MKAVCLACGKGKWGALTRCKACGSQPESFAEQARHILASEEHVDEAGRVAISRRVLAGEPLGMDPETIDTLAAELEAIPAAPLWFALLVVGVPVAVLLFGVFALACLLS